MTARPHDTSAVHSSVGAAERDRAVVESATRIILAARKVADAGFLAAANRHLRTPERADSDTLAFLKSTSRGRKLCARLRVLAVPRQRPCAKPIESDVLRERNSLADLDAP